MEFFIAVLILAVLQGVGEFLPISSSGHLLVMMDFFEWLGFARFEEPETLGILLHFGTLLAVLVVYFERILKLLTQDRRLLVYLCIASIPVVIVGGWLKLSGAEKAIGNSLVAGFCFIGTAFLLLFLGRKTEGTQTASEMPWWKALIIGTVQAIAILPGFSRSGFTICGGLASGLRRDEAATFSFLLSIPVIGGAALLETLILVYKAINGGDAAKDVHELGIPLLIFGTLVSFLVGWIALKWLLKWLEQGKLYYFSYYLFVLGPLVVVWRLFIYST